MGPDHLLVSFDGVLPYSPHFSDGERIGNAFCLISLYPSMADIDVSILGFRTSSNQIFFHNKTGLSPSHVLLIPCKANLRLHNERVLNPEPGKQADAVLFLIRDYCTVFSHLLIFPPLKPWRRYRCRVTIARLYGSLLGLPLAGLSRLDRYRIRYDPPRCSAVSRPSPCPR